MRSQTVPILVAMSALLALACARGGDRPAASAESPSPVEPARRPADPDAVSQQGVEEQSLERRIRTAVEHDGGVSLHFDGTATGVECRGTVMAHDPIRTRVELSSDAEVRFGGVALHTKIGSGPCTIPYDAVYELIGKQGTSRTFVQNVPPSLKRTVAKTPNYPLAYRKAEEPVPRWLAKLHSENKTPRIHINGRFQGVICPKSVLDAWGERLVVDLPLAYPLELDLRDDTVSATLSFNGEQARCSFPYRSIYVVAERDTGHGIVIDANQPDH